MDLAEAMAPKSDQMNGDDLLTAPRTVTIKAVRIVGGEQPVSVDLVEFPRPWKPSKSMLRVLASRDVWGPDETKWAGGRLTLFRDPGVKFGGDAVGGIRVSHVSGITQRTTVQITLTRGRKGPYTVEPLPASAPTSPPIDEDTVARVAELRAEWKTADDARKAEIESQVQQLQGGGS
jgi:hypothetical protein